MSEQRPEGRPVPKEAIEEAVSHMLGYAARGVQIKMYADSARAYKYASDIQRWMENLSPASEPAKVECPNCGECVEEADDHEWAVPHRHAELYTCKPAQPEPVAEEMPFLRDELSRLLNRHSRENHSNTPDFVLAGFLMDALCAWERATGERDTFFGQNPRFATEVNGPERAQPAKARMTEELEELLRWARDAAGNVGSLPYPSAQENEKRIRMMIDKVRAQAAEAGKVTLPKVREFLDLMGLYYRITDPSLPQKAHTQGSAWRAALAELEAAEGGKS